MWFIISTLQISNHKLYLFKMLHRKQCGSDLNTFSFLLTSPFQNKTSHFKFNQHNHVSEGTFYLLQFEVSSPIAEHNECSRYSILHTKK